ncbi:MAG TPA: hypothetical protein VMT52_08425 [Planctomycetota bacterium]|nr:hypothetical protein [Planctomycetota bacterium]
MRLMLISLLAALLLRGAVHADVILLWNGNEIHGEVLKEEGNRVIVQFPGGILELDRKQVRSVRRQARSEYLIDEAEKLLRRGENQAAVGAYLEAAQEDPGSSRAQKGLLEAREEHALELEGLGRYAEARSAFEEILLSNPAHERAIQEIEVIDETLLEAKREEERGLEEVASGDVEQGAWRLQRIFDRFPDRRKAIARPLGSAIIREGNRLLQEENWVGAEAWYLRALSVDPELLPFLRNQFVWSKVRQIEPLVRAGDFVAVEAETSEGLEVDPLNTILHFYRGLALEAKGKPRDAAEEYLLVTEGKRPSSLEASVMALRQAAEAKLVEASKAAPTAAPASRQVLAGGFREMRTEHFMILHRNAELAREVALVAERTYAETFRALECQTHLINPMRVEVHPTREEYVASGRQSWSGGAHQIARKRGELSEHRISTFQDEPRLLTGVLPHEIAHALLAHRLNYPDEIPLWANEGFAVWREPEYLHGYYRKLLYQESARKTLIPLEDLLFRVEYPGERVDLFYAQSYSVAEFLISLDSLATFLTFVKHVGNTRGSFDAALKRHFKIAGLKALETQWRGWVGDAARRR